MISPVKIWRRQKEIRGIIGKSGKIVTYTRIYVASPAFKKQTPYAVVLVELDDKTQAYGQLVDYKDLDLAIGKRVVAVLRRVRETTDESVISYGVKFKPQ